MTEFKNVTRVDGVEPVQGEQILNQLYGDAREGPPAVDVFRAAYEKQPITMQVVSRMTVAPGKSKRQSLPLTFVQGDEVGLYRSMSWEGSGFENAPFDQLQGLIGQPAGEADGVPRQAVYTHEQLRLLNEQGYEIVICQPVYRARPQE